MDAVLTILAVALFVFALFCRWKHDASRLLDADEGAHIGDPAYIRCDRCGKHFRVGDTAYRVNGRVYCTTGDHPCHDISDTLA